MALVPDASRYAVLLERPEDLQPARLAAALARHRGIPLQDAARQARHAWGIVGEDLEEPEARRLAEALGEAGLGGIVLPHHRLAALPPPALMARAEWDDDGLRLITAAGEEEPISWPRLRLLAVGGLTETTTSRVQPPEGPGLGRKAVGLGLMMATGLPMITGRGRRPPEPVQRSEELVVYLDLCRREPPRRFRINALEFDYSGLGDRMLPHALGNFRTLTAILAQRAPGASRNRGAEVLLTGQSLKVTGYDSLADFDRESRWLLTLDDLRHLY